MKLMELVASVALDSAAFDAGILAARSKGSSLASTLTSSLGGAASFLGNTIGNVASQITSLIARAADETFRLAETILDESLTAFAETEQLYGGVETMFGESADLVKKNAEDAFRTAGMSANEYMQTVTNFSASLLQGLGGDTKTAAEYADMAMKDMADNANKFGTSMSAIQYAYQGFAKDNYTMLDNLKLGYGGTAAEMARLVNDSGVLGDTLVTAANVSEVPLHKIFEAIHVIQQEMGVTGTTAEEASTTISGSFNAVVATYKNLVSGLADDQADVEVLVDNLYTSVVTLYGNVAAVIPRIGQSAIIAFDALLSNWDVYNNVKAAFEEKGLAGAFDVLTTTLSAEFAKWAPLAYTAGTDLLAQVYSGLTGNTTSGEDVRAYIDQVWTDVTATAQGFIVFAGGILGTVYTTLTGQEATVENIKGTFSGLFTQANEKLAGFKSDAIALFSGILSGMGEDDINGVAGRIASVFGQGMEAYTAFKDAAGALFGTIYTTLTGQEATAENIGNTLGGIFDGALTAASSLLTTASTFFGDFSAALGDPDATLLEKVSGIFKAGTAAMGDLISAAGNFFADLYEAMGGDSEFAQAMREGADALGDPEAWNVDPLHESTWEHIQDYAQEMYKNPGAYGVTQQQVSDWIDIVGRLDPSSPEYNAAATAITEAYYSQPNSAEAYVDFSEALHSLENAILNLPGGLAEAISVKGFNITINARDFADVINRENYRTTTRKLNTVSYGR